MNRTLREYRSNESCCNQVLKISHILQKPGKANNAPRRAISQRAFSDIGITNFKYTAIEVGATNLRLHLPRGVLTKSMKCSNAD